MAAAFAPAATARCGQTIVVHAAHPAAQPPPLVVGDSVLYGAAQAVAGEGFDVNAMVCRQMSQGIALLSARAGSLPHLVVLELGTNGPVSPQDIAQVLTILGPSRTLALVTPHNGVAPEADTVIRAAARQHPGQVGVLDWDRYSAGHPNWLGPDGIHLGGSAGIDAFARLLATALPYATPRPATPSTTTAPTPTTPTTLTPAPSRAPRPASPRRPKPAARPGQPVDSAAIAELVYTASAALLDVVDAADDVGW